MKKTNLAIILLCIVLVLTACSSKEAKNIDKEVYNFDTMEFSDYFKSAEYYEELQRNIKGYMYFSVWEYNNSDKKKLEDLPDVAASGWYERIMEYADIPEEDTSEYRAYQLLIEPIISIQEYKDSQYTLRENGITKSEEWYDNLKQKIIDTYIYYTTYEGVKE